MANETQRHYITINEVRSTVIAVDGANSTVAAVNAVLRAYRNGNITLNHSWCIIEDRTVIQNETPDWEKAVAEGYNDLHFTRITVKG